MENIDNNFDSKTIDLNAQTIGKSPQNNTLIEKCEKLFENYDFPQEGEEAGHQGQADAPWLKEPLLGNKHDERNFPGVGDGLEQPSPEQEFNRVLNNLHLPYSRPQMNMMQKLNIFVYNNYLLLIIIIFAGIFIMVPAVLLSKRDFTKNPRVRIQADDIIKPFVDKRNYRFLRLSNFMNVMLVSDPEMIGAGAALQANIGSSFEPKEIPGLAHFLEHMLFMGSHKYPEENAFKDYLSQHGGNCNAFTNDENTTFYFALGAEGFERALDMFSRFFIDPLFKSDMVDREVSAINSEYENDLQSNNWRWLELIRMLSNQNHPFHRFTIGNTRTLKDIPSSVNVNVRKELIKFFRNYYSPERMSLVIIGNLDMNSLERMTVDKFSQIPYNKNWKKPSYLKNIPEAFPSDKLGKFVWYKPVGKQKIFSIIFPLKSNQNQFGSNKALDYLSALLGYEGKNSLKSFLSSKGWLNAINVGSVKKTADFQLFYIDFSLTDLGIRNIIEIAESLFAYLKIIKKHGVSKDVFKQFGLMSYLNFMYKERAGLQNDLISLVGRLGNYPLNQLLIGPEVFLNYNDKDINEYIDELKVERSLFVIGTAEVEKDQILERIQFRTSAESSRKATPQEYNTDSLKSEGSEAQKSKFLETAFDTDISFPSYPREFEEEITSIFKDITNELARDEKVASPKTPPKASLPKNPISEYKHSTQKLFRLVEKGTNIFNSNDNDEDDLSEDELQEQVDNNKSVKNDEILENQTSTKANSTLINSNISNESNNSIQTPQQVLKDSANLFSKEQKISPYKRLDKYYDIMKIYYAVEAMNESFVNRMNNINESLFEKDLKIPGENKYIPESLELETNCRISANELRTPEGRATAASDIFVSPPVNNSSPSKSFLKTKAKPNLQDDVGQLRRKIRKSNTTELFNDLIENLYDNPKVNRLQNISKSCFYREVNKDLNEDYPNLLVNSSDSEFWMKSDRSYLSPKSMLSLGLGSVDSYKTARKALLTNLITDHLQISLSEELYDAQLMGYEIKLKNNEKGLEFLFGGFSDKIPLLVKRVLQGFKELKFDSKVFELIKETHLRNFDNFDKLAPSEQCERFMNKALRKYYYYEKDLKKEINNITLQELISYHQQLLLDFSIKGLVVGNIRNNTALTLTQEINDILKANDTVNKGTLTLNKSHGNDREILKLPSDKDVVLRIFNENPEDQNNAIVNYYQSGPRTMANLVMQIFFSGPLRNEAFSFLRTKNQLGYLVYSVNYPIHNIDGWILVLQGSKKTPDEMDSYVDKFLEDMMGFFKSKSEEVYHEAKNGFINALFSRDGSLNQRSAKYWDEILSLEYKFDRNQELAAAAKKLKKTDFIDFFESMFGKSRKKLSVQMYSGNGFSEGERSRLLLENSNNSLQNVTRSKIIVQDILSFQDMKRYDEYGIKRDV